MITIKEVLQFFGNASGLHTNLQKSLIAPIACSEDQINMIRNIIPAKVTVPYPILGPASDCWASQEDTLAATN